MMKKSLMIHLLSGFIILLLTVFFTNKLQVRAAFPWDLEEKNVIAYSLVPGSVIIYGDSALEEYKETVQGDSFKIRITRAVGEALYGKYISGDSRGWGWIPVDTVILDPNEENVYATVRDNMTIYTDSSCRIKRNRIKKYSGIILVSKEGDSRQVIYDKGDRYGIGWMKKEDYKNSLKYDGRQKQVLADGIYHFQCGTQDSLRDGGQTFRISHIANNCYRICDEKTGLYLRAQPNRRRKTWTLTWVEEADDIFGRFHISRRGGAFTIKNTMSNRYYARAKTDKARISMGLVHKAARWRVTAAEKIQDPEDPFVFTQYDPQWCALPYGSEGCMGTAGCGILAPVNAVYALSGQYMNVKELADYAVEKHYRIEGSGTSEDVFKALADRFGRKYGFAWDGTGKKLKSLKKKLKEGKVAVVHVPGHYVCVSAYDEKKDRYLLLDSNYLPKRKDSPYGDWIKGDRLLDGTLQSQGYFFYKLRER